MKKSLRRFTLVEMLTVVAIISVLAGLVIPVVIIAQERGRETQAKSDITSLMTALKQFDLDYGKVVKTNGNNREIGGKTIASGDFFETSQLGSDGKEVSSPGDNTVRFSNGDTDVYNAFIAELSVPKNKKFTSANPVSVNKRKRIYLEPKKGFNPTLDYDDAANTEFLWRDPWGNPYTVYVKTTKDGLLIPDKDKETSKKIAADFAVYSWGANGADDKGCNVNLDTCIYSSDEAKANHKLHDDIASWDL